MHCPRIDEEVLPRPRVPAEELVGQQIALQPIAPPARHHEVAECMGPAVRQRMHVVERREREIQRRRAIHAAFTAVAESRALIRVLEDPW
jgi:hypothetical protein